MHTVFTTDLINVSCPENMDRSTCELREYIKYGQGFFHTTINENHLMPNSHDLKSFLRVYNKMQNICKKCKKENGR